MEPYPLSGGGHQRVYRVLVLAVTLRTPRFLSVDNFQDILLNISILAIVALGRQLVIITHGIDLSVSSAIGLVAMMVAFVVNNTPHAVILAVALGWLWARSWE